MKLSVHRADCPNVRSLSEDEHQRLIDVSWTSDTEAVFPAEISVMTRDRMGLLKDITEIFSKEKHNILNMSTNRTKDGVQITFSIEVRSIQDLNRTLKLLCGLNGVISARRK